MGGCPALLFSKGSKPPMAPGIGYADVNNRHTRSTAGARYGQTTLPHILHARRGAGYRVAMWRGSSKPSRFIFL